MVQPLRKHRLNGTPYTRRSAVEAEIESLGKLSEAELEMQSRVVKTEDGFVSSEALLYFIRQTRHSKEHNETLLGELLRRVFQGLPKANDIDGNRKDLTAQAIRDSTFDHFFDLILRDSCEYDDRLDYFEVNFNSALASDRLDASRKYWTEAKRSRRLGNEDDDVLPEVELAAQGYDPFEADEIEKKSYRKLLNAAINALPELQKRIVEMHREGIPIDSSDPTKVTISKTLGKAEKTIRNQRDRAFATLRSHLGHRERM